MNRRALLVGISRYDYLKPDLNWCIDDVQAMQEVIASHANQGANFSTRTLKGVVSRDGTADEKIPDGERVTFTRLNTALKELFDFDGTILFYFAGHGIPKEKETYLAVQDGTLALPGISLTKLLDMANTSSAEEVILILDACYSGDIGEPQDEADIPNMYLRPGITVLASTSPNQQANEDRRLGEASGHGVFTRLVLDALKGGAADVRGLVSVASIYAYAEQALGPWQQRPVYKSNAKKLSPIRFCKPDITDDDLRRLPLFFRQATDKYVLDPTYEVTRPEALPEHVAIFNLFKRYQVARLLRPTIDDHLYFAALSSHPVELMPLGQFYWQLAKEHRLGDVPAFPSLWENPMKSVPDAESVAKLFHTTYERLAPHYGYGTRLATRVPWEQVPEQNRQLMIATAAEVLAALFPLEDPSAPEDAAEAVSPADPPEINEENVPKTIGYSRPNSIE
jgi:hypothetical protein